MAFLWESLFLLFEKWILQEGDGIVSGDDNFKVWKQEDPSEFVSNSKERFGERK